MTEQEQIKAMAADITRVIDRYRLEFHLTLASAIGVLEVLKLEIFKQQDEP
jgi:hypothetical protein